MPIKSALPKIVAAVNADLEDKIYQMWLQFLPNMNRNNYVSFADFRDSITGANIDRRSNEEILAEVEEVRRRLGNGSESV